MSQSADENVRKIIFSYLQLYEVAIITNEHTAASYYNAIVTHGAAEYVHMYEYYFIYFDRKLHMLTKFDPFIDFIKKLAPHFYITAITKRQELTFLKQCNYSMLVKLRRWRLLPLMCFIY